MINYAILINKTPSTFFRAYIGLRQGFPLSSLLFLLVIDNINSKIQEACDNDFFHGLDVIRKTSVTHLMSVYDMLIFGQVLLSQWRFLYYIMP